MHENLSVHNILDFSGVLMKFTKNKLGGTVRQVELFFKLAFALTKRTGITQFNSSF